ncbi:ketopantoate reductase family protein [Ruminococcus bicirculans (ex Wegman et al. 2014)]|jgi:hypothetical protein|uniref:2-dehydropantoate 2-reductase n=1 Tax=Ruminococcus bicirculans (ex Wegman et al. 2014) TaxID=1160721 RepID=A0AAW5KQE8_9FIRM|nr:ketopantoate reductase family protein [Ruminococcus bicirculans (ex Wegman et al. 2014)]MCQ5154089.1 ketopantoate reductase family protein [Ruminococcus bicirculans (ex Wegman et al. 2014)]
MGGYVALMGLGAVGVPIANLLFDKYKDNFILLSSKEFLHTLTDEDVYINNKLFNPVIVSEQKQLKEKIGLLILTVKNYHIISACRFLENVIDENTVILPLQNGIYSYDYLKGLFPNNVILEGFAKGPNTICTSNGFEYQRAGELHIGTTNHENKEYAKSTYDKLVSADIECYYEDNIQREVWKKLMLNVAGNAITAITGIDYCDFKHSEEVQNLCRKTMREFLLVSNAYGIDLNEDDIDDVMSYYLSFNVSKHTSMLEDVIHKRKTENEFIAGYISRLAIKLGIYTPNIDMLYELIKIKETVYLRGK